MKKIALSLFAIIFAINFSYAQWSTVSGNTTTSDNVGIGTTTPFTKFDVQTGSNAHLLFTSTDAAHPTFTFADVAGNPQYGTIKTYDLLVTNGTANFLKVSSLGNVGIGTASPAYSFHINKSTATLALDGITGDLGNSGAVINLLGWAASNKNWQIGVANIGPAGLNFTSSTTIAGSTFTTPMMTIADNGNVGVGTTVPDEKLTVLGTMHAKEVKVDLGVPGPDYVFLPDYKLAGLSELKAYVHKNHHLPEVPAAEQMAKETRRMRDKSNKVEASVARCLRTPPSGA